MTQPRNSDRFPISDTRPKTFAKVTSWGKEQILSARPVHTVYEK